MRILVLTNLYPPHSIGGYERVCEQTVNYLRGRGHEVQVLTGAYATGTVCHDDDALRVVRTVFDFDPGSLDEHSALDVFRANRRALHFLKRLLRDFSPQVVYVWNMAGLPMALVTAAHDHGVPVVFSLHDTWLLDNLPLDSWMLRWQIPSAALHRRAVKGAVRPFVRRVVPMHFPSLADSSAHFVSRSVASRTHSGGIHFRREKVIHNGVDVAQFTPPKENTGPASRLLFVGRLTPEKGADLAIRTLVRLTRQSGAPAAQLTLAGVAMNPDYLKGLRHLARAGGVHDRVHFIGQVSPDAMPDLYRHHNVLIFPSRVPEGLPLAVLEAQASGLPVIATASGGTAEALADGVTGLLVATSHEESLARAVRDILEDHAARRRMADAAVCRVQRMFNREQSLEATEAFLSEAAS